MRTTDLMEETSGRTRIRLLWPVGVSEGRKEKGRAGEKRFYFGHNSLLSFTGIKLSELQTFHNTGVADIMTSGLLSAVTLTICHTGKLPEYKK